MVLEYIVSPKQVLFLWVNLVKVFFVLDFSHSSSLFLYLPVKHTHVSSCRFSSSAYEGNTFGTPSRSTCPTFKYWTGMINGNLARILLPYFCTCSTTHPCNAVPVNPVGGQKWHPHLGRIRELQKERENQKACIGDEQRLWQASLQQLLQCFATFSSEVQRESGVGEGEGGASQQPLLCRMHAGCQTMIIQESKTEGDSSTAKYSVLPPVSFYLALLLCLAAAAVLLLPPLRRTLRLSVCIFACW